MTPTHSESSAREQRLNEAIASYLQQKASGAAPDRQRWLSEYPELAAELAEFLADQDQIEAMIGQLRPGNQQGSPAGCSVEKTTPPHSDDDHPSTVTYSARPPRATSQRYHVQRFHARGGMGEVWLAEDDQIGRRVALKRLRGGREDQQERFLAEAQITGQLEHPGIVPLHDLGADEDGRPFYVMKYVEGRTLKDAILEYHSPVKSPSTPRDVQQLRLLKTFIDLCHTVAFAHSRGVLHRDLKPSNIMLGQYGEMVLLDWGLAKIMAEPERHDDSCYVHVSSASGSTATQDGSVMGSPAYMAPEMAEGRIAEVDETLDVYLLGATLYEILTGRPPREGSSQVEMVEMARTVTPAAPRKVDPAISPVLEAICLKAMARRMQDRYRTALEVAEDVQRYLAGEPVSAYQENFLERFFRWCRRHRRLLKRAFAATALLAVALVVASWVYRAEQRAAQAELRGQVLQEQQQARSDLEQFHSLADQMRFFAASSDPTGEHAPYYDLQRGVDAGRAALELAKRWGAELDQLPLPDERAALKEELYGLHLLMVQARLNTTYVPKMVEDLLAVLDQAAAFREPTQGYYRLRAECSNRLGQTERADQEERMARDPSTPSTALDHFLRGEGHRMTAETERDPDEDPWARGVNRYRLEKAIREYREALLKDPGHYWSHFQIGRCLLSLGQYSEAVEALGACVALRPDSPWAYSVRGVALALSGDFDEAHRDFNLAIGNDPEFYPARLNRGVTYWLQQEIPKAVADFTAVLQAPEDKRLIEAAYYRGRVYLEQAKYADALNDFDLVVQHRPGFQHVYRSRAEVRFLLGQNDRGIDDLNAFLSLAAPGKFEADSWQACLHRGRFLRGFVARIPESAAERRGAVAQLALAELERAAAQDGRSAEVFEDLGGLREAFGDVERAIGAYSQGLKLAPENTKLRNLRAWANALKLGKYDQALVDFAETLRTAPENAEAHTGIGFIHARLKALDNAQKSAAEALLHGDGDYLVLHNVACIYAELSQTETDRASEYQDLALVELRRAVRLWTLSGRGDPDELELIKNEPSFPPSLRARKEFQQLFKQGNSVTGVPEITAR